MPFVQKRQNRNSRRSASRRPGLREEPSYLCWLMEKVDGCEDIKKAISELPGFREEWEKYFRRKHRKELTTRQMVEETVRRMIGAGQQPDTEAAEALDDLCDWLFHEPAAEDTARLKVVQGLHYGKYVQSGENLSCVKTGDEQYRFQVCDAGLPGASTSPGPSRPRPTCRKCRWTSWSRWTRRCTTAARAMAMTGTPSSPRRGSTSRGRCRSDRPPDAPGPIRRSDHGRA